MTVLISSGSVQADVGGLECPNASWPFGGLSCFCDSGMISGLLSIRIPMVDFLIRLSWLFFNVAVPVFAPVALLPLLNFSRYYRHAARGITRRSIQDGQLFWVVISMCASACYEIGSALSEASTHSTLVLMLAALLWHVLFIVAASVLVCLGAADAAVRPARHAGEQERDSWLMWFSMLITVAIAVSFSASHYSFT
ncbi:hypothetical protein [Paraburkholderia caffeinilytica]|uniref:hypothetical protein n=1 Tax=Paraburkholderia caffeinilytica TaxID=1761016 RepID=UPI0038BC1C4D